MYKFVPGKNSCQFFIHLIINKFLGFEKLQNNLFIRNKRIISSLQTKNNKRSKKIQKPVAYRYLVLHEISYL